VSVGLKRASERARPVVNVIFGGFGFAHAALFASGSDSTVDVCGFLGLNQLLDIDSWVYVHTWTYCNGYSLPENADDQRPSPGNCLSSASVFENEWTLLSSWTTLVFSSVLWIGYSSCGTRADLNLR